MVCDGINCLEGMSGRMVWYQGRDIDTMAVISFATTKGGGGKTTSCIILGTEVARSGVHVTIIDADEEHRVVDWAERRALPRNISVIQCLSVDALSSAVKEAQTRSALVLIDLEGIASRLNSAAIARSNLVIIPMGDEQPDANAAVKTLRVIKQDEETLGRPIPTRILFNKTDAGVKSGFAREINRSMRDHVPCFETELHKRAAFSKLHNVGGNLYDLDPERAGRLESAKDNAAAFVREVQAVLKAQLEMGETR